MNAVIADKVSQTRVQILQPDQEEGWNRFVLNHPYGWITHTAEWKKVLEKSFSHMKGFYFSIANSEGIIQAALPIFKVSSILTGDRFVSIPFATLSDVLASNTDELEHLLDAWKQLSEQTRISKLEIRTLCSASIVEKAGISSSSYYVHHFLKLEHPDILKKKFHYKSVRYEINKADKNNLTLRAAESEADLMAFYRLYVKTRKRLCLPPQPYKFFKQLWKQFHPDSMEIYFAEHALQKIAALLVLKYKNRVSAEALGWDDLYEKASPNHFLFWNAIKSAYDQGYEIFDFGRTAKTNTGLMNFKARWGTDTVDFVHFSIPQANAYKSPEATAAYNLIKYLCRLTPEILMPLLGRACYRHLG